jgi:hypothetical protein
MAQHLPIEGETGSSATVAVTVSFRPGRIRSVATEAERRGAMHIAEMLVAEARFSHRGGPYRYAGLAYGFDDQTIELLSPILKPYGQSPHFFFDRMNYGRPPAPWAIACLPHEYRLAGHVREARQGIREILFAPYTKVPDPLPADFEPAVGVLVFMHKSALSEAAGRSPLLASAWEALATCDEERYWCVLLDPPEKGFLSSFEGAADREEV